jgi:endonuclease-8
MPEGDTVHTLASLLSTGLLDQRVLEVSARRIDCRRLAGRRVTGVDSHGKHLYLVFDDELALRSHLGLYGSWHRYRPQEAWRKPPRQASLVLRLEDWVYVCFNAREVDLLPVGGFRAADQRRSLGPDLSRVSPDAGSMEARARSLLHPDTPIVDLLLDQRVAAGIGNVFKSEVLFLECRSPRLCLGDLGPTDFDDLYGRAATLIQGNLTGGPRTTRESRDGRGLLWVYGRAQLPCLVCGQSIQRARLGRNPRSTYWCACCQGE